MFLYDAPFYTKWFAPEAQDADVAIRSWTPHSTVPELLARLRGRMHVEIECPIQDTGFLRRLARAHHIEELSVAHGNDKMIEQIALFTSLRRLHIHGTEFSGDHLSALSSLRRLSVLDFSRSGVRDEALRHIRTFHALTELNLSQTDITDDGLAELEGLRLKTLYLSETRISERSIESLSTLYHLSRLRTNIDGKHFIRLRHLPLVELSVGIVEVDSRGVPIISTYFPNCEIYYSMAYFSSDDYCSEWPQQISR